MQSTRIGYTVGGATVVAAARLTLHRCDRQQPPRAAAGLAKAANQHTHTPSLLPPHAFCLHARVRCADAQCTTPPCATYFKPTILVSLEVVQHSMCECTAMTRPIEKSTCIARPSAIMRWTCEHARLAVREFSRVRALGMG
ncbi:hypothetical protein EON66_09440 [archaeon]|nr:MAG: hypothetical protein EON66_09440 [archaeon]